jgi:hypothetical protein
MIFIVTGRFRFTVVIVCPFIFNYIVAHRGRQEDSSNTSVYHPKEGWPLPISKDERLTITCNPSEI